MTPERVSGPRLHLDAVWEEEHVHRPALTAPADRAHAAGFRELSRSLIGDPRRLAHGRHRAPEWRGEPARGHQDHRAGHGPDVAQPDHRSGEEAPDQLLANPANWRIHPKAQQDALAGARPGRLGPAGVGQPPLDTALLAGSRADGAPIYAPEWLDMAALLGTRPRARRPYRAQTKGKVERVIGELKEDFLAWLTGQVLPEHPTLAWYDAAAQRWAAGVHAARRHRPTGRVIGEAWADERPLLLPVSGRLLARMRARTPSCPCRDR